MKKLLIVFFLVPLFIHAQNIPFSSGGRDMGMGQSSLAVSHVWSVSNNQGGLGYLENPEIALYYTNRFLLKELSSQSMVFAYPSKLGNWGVSVDYFGYSEQSELQLGLAYAKKINKYISLGVKFDYLQYQQAEIYGNTRAIVAEVGILSNPYENIFVGAHVYNPSRSKFNTAVEKYAPTIFNIGIAYKPDPMVSLTAQVDKAIDFQATYKVGVEMNLKESLFLRAGVNIQPNAYFLGLAYYFKNIKLDFAFSYQQVLGLSPASSIGYEFAPKLN
jgi:hypothetical protein